MLHSLLHSIDASSSLFMRDHETHHDSLLSAIGPVTSHCSYGPAMHVVRDCRKNLTKRTLIYIRMYDVTSGLQNGFSRIFYKRI